MTDEQLNAPPQADAPQGEPAPAPQSTGTFTQADLDRIAGQARIEGKTKALNDLLAELGIPDKDSLASLIQDATARQEKELSESQRLQKQLEKLQADLQAKDSELDNIRTQAQQQALENSLLESIRAANAQKPQDVLILLKANGTTGMMSEDGKPIADTITKAVQAFKKERPEYFRSDNPGSPSNHDGKPIAPNTPIARPKIKF